MVVEILLWIARMVHIIYELNAANWEFPYQDYFASSISSFFVLVLLLTGMSVGAKVIYRATKPQYSLLTNGNEESNEFRAATHFYPLRIIAFIQLAYTLTSWGLVFLPAKDESFDLGTSLLIAPAAGVLTAIAAFELFFCLSLGKRVLTYFAIFETIDMVTGVLRAIAGVLYIILWVNKGFKEPSSDHQLIMAISIGTAFPVFYWMLGIMTAYRTRVQIEMDAHLNKDDSVYGI